MELTREPEITILENDHGSAPVVGVSAAVVRDTTFVAAVRAVAGQVRPAFDPGCDVSIVEVSELAHQRGEPLLAVAASPTIAHVRHAVSLGASGVIDRTADPEAVAAGIAAAASGLTVVPADMAPLLLTRLVDPPPALALEPSDLELLQDVASGMTLDEVALVRDRSTRTIRRELRELWRRMGVSGRAPGLVLAARWGLVD
ncbi:MAG: hypothetical protein AAF480_00675 [Actinomycetota bacterium]